MSKVILEIEKEQMKKEVPQFNVGDTVKVFTRIIEGTKERIHGFEGLVIKRQGPGVGKTFTVRRIVQGIGIERTFVLHSPRLEKVNVIRKGKVRRAKLYYLRKRIGSKAIKVEEAKESK
jgi:large subunit ribosomal protein L19